MDQPEILTLSLELSEGGESGGNLDIPRTVISTASGPSIVLSSGLYALCRFPRVLDNGDAGICSSYFAIVGTRER